MLSDVYDSLVLLVSRSELSLLPREWVFDASSKDNYVPGKVHLMRRWR